MFQYFQLERLENRVGTNVDVDQLIASFTNLGISTEVFNDFTVLEIRNKITQISGDENLSHYSALIVTVLTHGHYGSLHARDAVYKPTELFAPFDNVNCPQMNGKPRIFFCSRFISWRNEFYGSFFIGTLCEILDKVSVHQSLEDMLVLVNRKLSLMAIAYKDDDDRIKFSKQLPIIYHTLTKAIKFY